jgi:DNA replication protein
MQGFAGFPDGKLPVLSLPEQFFSELLPLIDNLPELKVTLHCFWLLSHKQGEVRYVTLAELRGDELLLRGLKDAQATYPAIGPRDAVQEGVERAVARGTLLQVDVQRGDGRTETWYTVNSGRGRETMARIERGEWVPEGEAEPVRLEVQRPNIFNLYEQNVGLIQPMIAEELREAEQTYPMEWIQDAFRVAVENNVRNWAYVRAILQRWAREGRAERRGDEPRRRDIEGDYADLIHH